MLVTTKKHQICSVVLIIKMLNQNNEFSECFHARSWSMFYDVRVCYKQITVAEKAMFLTSQLILQESLFSDI